MSIGSYNINVLPSASDLIVSMQTNSVHVSNLGDIKLVENEETKTAGDDNDYEKEVTDNEIYEKKEDKSSWKGAVIEDKSLWFKFKFGKGENAPETR